MLFDFLFYIQFIYFDLFYKQNTKPMNQNKCLSPTKENISPTKHRKTDPISQLLKMIQNEGLDMPLHVMKVLKEGDSLKLRPVNEAETETSEKKLKVKISDVEFELKKMEEDFAQFRRNTKIEREKEVKKWEDAYQQMRQNYTESVEDSSQIIQKMKEEHQVQIAELKERHRGELKQELQSVISNYENKLKSQAKVYERDLIELREKSHKDLSSLQDHCQQQINEERLKHEKQIKKIQLKNKQALDSKDKQYEGMYLALQSEKKTEEKLHQKTKIDSSQTKQKLYNELFYERNVKKDLEHELGNKQTMIKNLKIQIRDLQAQMKVEEERASRKLKEEKENYQKRIIGISQLHSEQKCETLRKHVQDLNELIEKIAELQQWKKDKQEILGEKINLVEEKFNERPSRKEDLHKIEHLKGELKKKDEQTRILNKQLRNCALEIQNKQETYNRIFATSCSKRSQKKSSLNKERDDLRSRDSLFRKSQTADLKFLLKVYNKHI